MVNALEQILGNELFDTTAERERASFLLESVKDIFPKAKIKWLVPNMQKDATSKITKSGFFVFLEGNIVFEFRDFYASINFDYAKYDIVTNIRFLKDNELTRLEFRHTIASQFATVINVFGDPASKYLYKIRDEVTQFLTSG